MDGQTAVRDSAICPDCRQRVDVRLSGPIEGSGAKSILEPIRVVDEALRTGRWAS
jgi:hypothetical protein